MQRKMTRVGSGNNILGILAAFVLLVAIMSIFAPNFTKVENFLNVFQQVSINFVVALGMSYVIISGGIDLSIGSNMAVVGLLMAMMMKAGKSTTSMRQIASMPSSGYSSTSTFLMQCSARFAAAPPIEPR